MCRVIVEAWMSPKRKEVYSSGYITMQPTLANYVWEAVQEFLDEYGSDNIFSLFGETEQDGLWKIVVEVDLVYTRDHYGESDLEFNTGQVFAKTKSKNFSDLRDTWAFLTNRHRSISPTSGILRIG